MSQPWHLKKLAFVFGTTFPLSNHPTPHIVDRGTWSYSGDHVETTLVVQFHHLRTLKVSETVPEVVIERFKALEELNIDFP
jgi:hypothetical protein